MNDLPDIAASTGPAPSSAASPRTPWDVFAVASRAVSVPGSSMRWANAGPSS